MSVKVYGRTFQQNLLTVVEMQPLDRNSLVVKETRVVFICEVIDAQVLYLYVQHLAQLLQHLRSGGGGGGHYNCIRGRGTECVRGHGTEYIRGRGTAWVCDTGCIRGHGPGCVRGRGTRRRGPGRCTIHMYV